MILPYAKPIRAGLLALGIAALAGCVRPGAEPIVGPDGSQMLHVHCGADQGECFRLAGQSCPFGYDYAPVYDPKDGNFFVRCRSGVAAQPPGAAPPVAAAVAPAPAPTYAAPAPRPAPPAATNSDWPPGEVDRVTEPWNKEPAGVVSSGVPSATLPPTPRTKLGEVDIGY
jgi:hypothetical protein